MSLQDTINRAFENVAAHITNLSEMKRIIEEIAAQAKTINEAIRILETIRERAEVTLRTDIRILINEIVAMQRRE